VKATGFVLFVVGAGAVVVGWKLLAGWHVTALGSVLVAMGVWSAIAGARRAERYRAARDRYDEARAALEKRLEAARRAHG
jgi:membrane protein implicated in regulation of membrane protease activity